jgi:hypothetical protein
MSAIPRDNLVRMHHTPNTAQKARRFIQGRERIDLEMDESFGPSSRMNCRP